MEQDVIEITDKYGLSIDNINVYLSERIPKREQKSVLERIILAYELRKMKHTISAIANYLGLHHSTVIHYLGKAEDFEFTKDKDFLKYYEDKQ